MGITRLGLKSSVALIQQRFQRFNRITYGGESEVLSELLGICTVVVVSRKTLQMVCEMAIAGVCGSRLRRGQSTNLRRQLSGG